MAQLRSVTCHMGSHSVTCYPTQVNTPQPYRPVLDLPTPEGWMVELTLCPSPKLPSPKENYGWLRSWLEEIALFRVMRSSTVTEEIIIYRPLAEQDMGVWIRQIVCRGGSRIGFRGARIEAQQAKVYGVRYMEGRVSPSPLWEGLG